MHRHDEYRELRRRLRAAGLLNPQPRIWLRHLGIALALLAICGFLLIRFRAPWAVVLIALALAVATVQLDFLVHDAGHHQAFAVAGRMFSPGSSSAICCWGPATAGGSASTMPITPTPTIPSWTPISICH